MLAFKRVINGSSSDWFFAHASIETDRQTDGQADGFVVPFNEKFRQKHIGTRQCCTNFEIDTNKMRLDF